MLDPGLTRGGRLWCQEKQGFWNPFILELCQATGSCNLEQSLGRLRCRVPSFLATPSLGTVLGRGNYSRVAKAMLQGSCILCFLDAAPQAGGLGARQPGFQTQLCVCDLEQEFVCFACVVRQRRLKTISILWENKGLIYRRSLACGVSLVSANCYHYHFYYYY